MDDLFNFNLEFLVSIYIYINMYIAIDRLIITRTTECDVFLIENKIMQN